MNYKLEIKKLPLYNIKKINFNFIKLALPNLNKKKWNWEFLESYPMGYCINAKINGIYVAHNSFILSKFKLNKKDILVAKSEGSYADQELIRKLTGKNLRVFRELVKKALEIMKKEKISVAYGFPNNLGHKSYIYGGYSLKQIVIYNSNLIANFNYYFYKKHYKLNFLLKPFTKILNALWKNLFLKTLLLFSDKRINSVYPLYSKDLVKIENLFLKVSKKFPKDYLTVVRSKEYIEWRYLKNPYHKYYIFGLNKNKHLEGIIIFNIVNHKNFKNIEIKDIFYTCESSFNILLSFLMKWSINNDISIVTLWEDFNILKQVSSKIFYKNGFIKNRIKTKKTLILSLLDKNKIKNDISLELKKYLERT